MLYLKHLLIRTPLEAPARFAQRLLRARDLLKHPEKRELSLEDDRVHAVIQRELRSTSNCVDVGCHIGSMLSAFMRLAPAGNHWAFEPVATKARWLRKKFPEVNLREVALSNTPGRTTFHEDLTRPGFSSLKPAKGNDHWIQYEVDCALMDDIIPESHSINFLKLDVEGAELMVLQGARKTLRRCQPLVLFECGPGGPQRFGFEARDLYHFLTADLGYSIRTPLGQLTGTAPLSVEAFERTQVYPFEAFNFFATPPARAQAEVAATPPAAADASARQVS